MRLTALVNGDMISGKVDATPNSELIMLIDYIFKNMETGEIT